MNIEVIGAEFNNKGAELMLVAVCQQLSERLGKAPLMAPSLYANYQQRAALGLRQVLRLQFGTSDITPLLALLPRFVTQRLEYFGIVTEQHIDVVLDASGFAYAQNWPLARLKSAARIAKRVQARGGKYILLPQALGPFESAQYIAEAKNLFTSCALIYARDKTSLDAVKQVAPQANVKLASDFTATAKAASAALSLLKPTDAQQEIDQNTENVFCIIPNSNMLKVTSREQYFSLITALAKGFSIKGFALQVLNHEGKADRELCLELQRKLKADLGIACSFVEPSTALEVKAVIKQASWVFSSRYHGCVSGLSEGIPTLATSWSHKYEALYEDYRLPHYLLDTEMASSEVAARINAVFESREQDAKKQLREAEQVKLRINDMWDEILTFLNQ